METFERIIHSALFELFLLAISVPAVAWLSGQSVGKSGIVMVVLSLLVMVINYGYNLFFDRYFGDNRIKRSQMMRIGHALGFELVVLAFTLPVLAYMLNIGIWQALLLDLAFIVFVLFYSYLFNLAYDHIRASFTAKNSQTTVY